MTPTGPAGKLKFFTKLVGDHLKPHVFFCAFFMQKPQCFQRVCDYLHFFVNNLLTGTRRRVNLWS